MFPIKRFRTLRDDDESMDVLSKRFMAALVMIVDGNARNVSFEKTYNCVFKLLMISSPHGLDPFRGRERIESILKRAANLIVRYYPYTNPKSAEAKRLVVSMINDVTMSYSRSSSMFLGIDQTVQAAEEKFFNSKQQVFLRNCHSKLKEMAERARLAVLAKPGGADFLVVQQQHVEAGNMIA